MAQLAASRAERAGAASSGGAPIDRDHLRQMTLGDRSLAREVLTLFDRQAEILIARVPEADNAAAAALAHTLKGSARGIGAWQVAQAAEMLERATQSAERGDAVAGLIAAVDDARAAIAVLLHAH